MKTSDKFKEAYPTRHTFLFQVIQRILLVLLIMCTKSFTENGKASANIRHQLAKLRVVPAKEIGPDEKQAEPMRVSISSNGYVRFLGAPPAHHFPVSLNVPGDPETTAKNFLREHEALFGALGSATGFDVKKFRSKNNRNYVRFQQVYSAIPVFGGEVIIQLNESGGVACIISDIMRNTRELDEGRLSVVPAISGEAARDIAIEMFVRENPSVRINTSVAKLTVFDPSILGSTGDMHLVWDLRVYSEGDPLINERLLLDAHTGEVIRHYPLNISAMDREIYDANNTSSDPGTLERAEGDAASGIANVDDAYDFFGDTYNYYASQHGRDGIDDNGMTISATVRYCRSGSTCPYQNAFWSYGTERFYFGEDFVTDDVTAHEYTHGVTSYESDLIYENHSGAINESFSDVWGEYVDLENGAGDDSPGVRWEIGEDLPIGAIRDMSDPPRFSDPDRMGSVYFIAPVSEPTQYNDYGGVHTNCGVSNKLCYLLTDGDTFNGATVTGMGISRIADLYYEVQTNLLSSGADYTDFYYALSQAAVNLNWTVAERNNLYHACWAVEIEEESNVYVDQAHTGPEDGSITNPYNTVWEGYDAALPGDNLYIRTGTYFEGIIFNKIMMIRARDGDTVIDGRH